MHVGSVSQQINPTCQPGFDIAATATATAADADADADADAVIRYIKYKKVSRAGIQ